jgi:hypothetical protein
LIALPSSKIRYCRLLVRQFLVKEEMHGAVTGLMYCSSLNAAAKRGQQVQRKSTGERNVEEDGDGTLAL